MESRLQQREEASASQAKREQIEAIHVKALSRSQKTPPRTLLLAALLLASVLAGLGWYGRDQLYGASAERALSRELAAARAEGILTSAEEIEAEIRPIPESQNAAPLAAKMLEATPKSTKLRDLVWDASLGKDEARLAEVKTALTASGELLELSELAASKPGFVVKRDYKRGSLMLTPEFAGLSKGSSLLWIHSALLMREGRHDEAVAAFRESVSLIQLLEGDQMWRQFGASGRQREKAACLAASFALLQPESKEWLRELRRVLDSWPIPTERECSRYTLALALETFDAVKQHSRSELGYSEPPDWNLTLISKFIPELPAKTKAVKGFRKAWSVLDTPGTGNDRIRQEASWLFVGGLLSDPTLFQTTASLGPGDGLDHRMALQEMKQRKALFEAVYEVLSLPREKARGMKVSTILSPQSGLPFRVRWTGDGFTVTEASAMGGSPREAVCIPPTRQQWTVDFY